MDNYSGDLKGKLAFTKETHHQGVDPSKANWNELHTSRSGVGAALSNMMERADREKRELNESEQLAYNYGMSLLDAINADFALRDRFNTKDPVDPMRPVRSVPFPNPNAARSQAQDKTFSPGHARFKDIFDTRADDIHEAEFFDIVNRGVYDQRIEQRASVAGIGALGGFSVPSETAEKIFDHSLEGEIIRPRSLVLPVQYGGSLSIPLWNLDDHSAGLAGFKGVWMAEEQAGTPQDAALKLIRLELQKLMIYADVSNELIADGINFANQLVMQLSRTLSFNLDQEFLTGNGVGKPEGVQESAACIDVSRAGAGLISYDDVVAIFARLYPACWTNAVWLAHPSTIPQLANIKDAGSHNLWIQSAQDGMPGSLLGRPIYFTEKTGALGDRGDLGLYDFSQYCIIQRQEIAVQRSDSPQWYKDLTSFRAIVRVNGKSLWTAPVKPAKGSDSLSPFVVLD